VFAAVQLMKFNRRATGQIKPFIHDAGRRCYQAATAVPFRKEADVPPRMQQPKYRWGMFAGTGVDPFSIHPVIRLASSGARRPAPTVPVAPLLIPVPSPLPFPMQLLNKPTGRLNEMTRLGFGAPDGERRPGSFWSRPSLLRGFRGGLEGLRELRKSASALHAGTKAVNNKVKGEVPVR